MKIRIFFDMDGTLAVWKSSSVYDDLLKEGYFYSLGTNKNIIDLARDLIVNHSDKVEVFVLSAYLTDSAFALEDKANWLKLHLPELPMRNYIFVPYGRSKVEYVPNGIRMTDILVDDYTVNLLEWQGVGVKCMTGSNHTRKTWKGPFVHVNTPGYLLSEQMMTLARKGGSAYAVE